MSLGLCVHPKRLPPQADLDALDPDFLRSILYDASDLGALLATGVPLFITGNNEFAPGGWSAFDDLCRLVAAKGRGRILGFGCGNELAGYWSVNDRDVPPEFGADLIRRASAILRPAGIHVFTDAVTGNRWVEYLQRLFDLAGEHVDGVACQAAYGRAPDGWRPPGWSGGRWGFGELSEVVSTIRAMTTAPIVFTEAGVKIGEAGGEAGQASYVTALDAACADLGVRASFFCYEDSQGKPGERGASAFGLVREDGIRRPAFGAFAALHKEPTIPVNICPPAPDLKAFGKQRADAEGVPWPMIEKQFQQESGWRHCRDDGSLVASPSNAIGVCQIIQRWHPGVDVADPWASLTYAVHWMRQLRDKYGSWKHALMAYNWGPGNLETWIRDGSDDGRIRGETRRYLDVILGPGWPEPGATPAPGIIFYENYRDPEPAGAFARMPGGVILHGSRSGTAGNPKEKEYLGTARYEQSNTAGLGWHATIGEHIVAVHLTPREWGWNALQASKAYLGVELAQATVDEPITDAQVAAFCDWFTTRVLPVWPNIPLNFPSHPEVDREFGINQGKSDAFPLGDARMDDLRARIMAGLGTDAPAKPSPYEVGEGILAAMRSRGDQPASNEVYTKRGERDEWSEAFGTSGRRYIYLPSINRIFIYDPAA